MENHNGNATVELIVSRLLRKPLLNAREVADALMATTTKPVTDAIESGELQAARVGRPWLISRTEAARWIREKGASK